MKVVLHSPQIPQNCGSIARTCAATGIELVLIRPLGFDISAKAVRRAGLDYWENIKIEVFDSLTAFLSEHTSRFWLFSKFGEQRYSDIQYKEDDMLIFGNETIGLPPDILDRYWERVLKIPLNHKHVRSLNLSNAVSIAVYEALRQLDFNLRGNKLT